MSEQPSSDVAGGTAPAGEALTPTAIDTLLADFRAWLESAAQQPSPPPRAEPVPVVDLHTLVGEFVALRQEVNLQTRASRTQLEQSAQSLQQLAQAMELLEQGSPADPPTSDEDRVRPLLKT